MAELRLIKKNDIPGLTGICRMGMEYDVWYDDLLREKTIEAKDYLPELGLVIEEEGELAGFIQGVLGTSSTGETFGKIRLLAVHPKFRRRGIGGALLTEAETRLIERGAKTISIMDVPANYQMPGVDFRYTEAFCFLPKHGYTCGMPNINLVCGVSPRMFDQEEDIERLKKEDFIIRRAQESDWNGIEKFLAANWKCWIDEARSSFDNKPKTLHICIHKGEVVGFSGYEGNNKGMGWFGPMGVLPVTRGKGIGAILCLLCLQDIALLGHRRAIIPWVGPVRFYDKVCGAVIDRVFWTWSKKIAKE
ncbi:GNAT family N-acetyltransferase [Candidatus Sumerlaeota bacterium]|nr:GNAT family N-acetyltransferase [Candidatus Sumerlaeota bacterium]